MAGNPNLTRMNRQALYELKRDYGVPVAIYKMVTASTDYETGAKTSSAQAYHVKRCVVMPAATLRKFFYGVSYLGANKSFVSQGGQGWDESNRGFLIEGRDLPNFVFEKEDWVVHDGRRYDIDTIETLENGDGWLIVGKHIRGSLPQQEIRMNVVDTLYTTQELEGDNEP